MGASAAHDGPLVLTHGSSKNRRIIAPLSWFYESRGVAGAVGVAGFALLQDTIFVATVVAVDQLSVASGAALAVALETIAATTVWVWVKVGPDFGRITLGYEMLVLLGFTPVLVCAASPSLPPPGAVSLCTSPADICAS